MLYNNIEILFWKACAYRAFMIIHLVYDNIIF